MSFTARAIVVLFAMLLASGLAAIMRPRTSASEQGSSVNLEAMIPTQFGEWSIDSTVMPVLPNPEQTALIKILYSQTLSRTYSNAAGQRVMLVVAYGDDQGRTLQIHKPEVCYVGQGFQIGKLIKTKVDLGIGNIPAMKLIAKQGRRNEPITYWIRIGDKVARGWLEQNIARVSYGLQGQIPDGMLVRVSNISDDEQTAFNLHTNFLSTLIKGMSKKDRIRFVGNLDN